MKSRVIALAKAVLPLGIYTPARAFAFRLIAWHQLLAHVRGVRTQDGFWLWVSFLTSSLTASASLREWEYLVPVRDITVKVSDVGCFAVRAYSDDLYHILPFRERAVLECTRAMLRPGDCFVDAGANIGFYTIVGARIVGRTGTVLAVEMLKETTHILRDNIRLNDACCARVVEGALSTREGEVLPASVPEGTYGQASINGAAECEQFEVRTTTLDAILREAASVRLLKMDIEGAELEALKGGAAVLDRIEGILFEYMEGRAFEETRAFLSSHGFRIERLDGRNGLALRS